MSLNPYEPPAASPADVLVATIPGRDRARTSLRIALLILLVPAIYNYCAFDMQWIAGSAMRVSQQAFSRTANILGFAIVAPLIWTAGLPILERVSEWLRRLLGRQVSPSRWQEALYCSLRPAAYLAIPGAILWTIWVFGFYYLRIGFVPISYAIGIPAHLLAACLYLPLLYRWYRLVWTQ